MSEPKVVILIGAARSGTKLLRDLLASADDVACVPYDVGYVWRYGNESYPSDEFVPDMARPDVIQFIRSTIFSLTASAGTESTTRIVVEKSVPNTLRVDFVRKVFPEAKIVHLIRDGRAVTESSMQQWLAPARKDYLLKKLKYFPWRNYRYALWYISDVIHSKLCKRPKIWGPRYSGIEQDVSNEKLSIVCSRQWRKCVESSCEQLRDMPKDQFMEIRYEQLIAGDDVLKKLCSFLDVHDTESVVEAYRNTINKDRVDSWRRSINKEDYILIANECGQTLEVLGYGNQSSQLKPTVAQ